jgi:hypothetical protein
LPYKTLKNRYDSFIKEYDKDGDLKFNDIHFRDTVVTEEFGLAPGFRTVNGNLVWDTVRIHTGVDHDDKWDGEKEVENHIIAPFNFDKSFFADYGEDHVYGSIIRLFNSRYGFELRIVHCYPEEISKKAMDQFKKGSMVNAGTNIGKAGSYGTASTGRHTHSEIVSTCGEINPILHEILFNKYGREVFEEYNKQHIVNYYKKFKHHTNQSDKQIMSTYSDHKEDRRCKFANNYFMTFKDWFQGMEYRTRYSISLLFNL